MYQIFLIGRIEMDFGTIKFILSMSARKLAKSLTLNFHLKSTIRVGILLKREALFSV
jgi:hypothetical protein